MVTVCSLSPHTVLLVPAPLELHGRIPLDVRGGFRPSKALVGLEPRRPSLQEVFVELVRVDGRLPSRGRVELEGWGKLKHKAPLFSVNKIKIRQEIFLNA